MVINIIIAIIIFCLYILKTQYSSKSVYIQSDIDNEQYLVQDRMDKQRAANMLAKLRKDMLYLTSYLYKNKDKYQEYATYINRLHLRIDNSIINESDINSVNTSYSVNKGEQLVFCLRSRVNNDRFHEHNLLMYVVLHEMAHVACPIYDGHGELFKKIFSFLTIEAIKLGIYHKIDFNHNPQEYCGMMVSDSIV